MYNRVESLLRSKRNAEYVRHMVHNNAKPQHRLYQRALEKDREIEAQLYASQRRAAAKSLAVTKRESSTLRGGAPMTVKKLGGEQSNLQVTDVDDSSDQGAQKTQRNGDLDGELRSQTPNSQRSNSDYKEKVHKLQSQAQKKGKEKDGSLQKAGERELVTDKARIKVESLVALIKKQD